jgi:hypothetical protein
LENDSFRACYLAVSFISFVNYEPETLPRPLNLFLFKISCILSKEDH